MELKQLILACMVWVNFGFAMQRPRYIQSEGGMLFIERSRGGGIGGNLNICGPQILDLQITPVKGEVSVTYTNEEVNYSVNLESGKSLTIHYEKDSPYGKLSGNVFEGDRCVGILSDQSAKNWYEHLKSISEKHKIP